MTDEIKLAIEKVETAVAELKVVLTPAE